MSEGALPGFEEVTGTISPCICLLPSPEETNILVFDMGGGTFDVSVLTIQELLLTAFDVSKANV